MAAIELADGQQIQRGGEQSYPRCAADGVKKQVGSEGVRLEDGGGEPQRKRNTEDHVRVIVVTESRHNPRMQNAVGERRKSKQESDERTGCTDIEQRSGGTNRRANQDERAERSDQRGRGNEKRVGRMDVMVSAGEVVAKLVRKENRKQCEREGNAGEKKGRMIIREAERLHERVERGSLIVSVRCGEVRAGDQAGTEGQKKQKSG